MTHPNNIDWIVFDIGGVLINIDFQPTIGMLSQRSGLPEPDVRNVLLGRSDGGGVLADALSTGNIDLKTYLSETIRALKGCISPRELIILRQAELTTVNKALAQTLPKLKSRYHLACFSNSNVIHWGYMLKNYDFFRYFSVKMGSHIAGARKPDVAAYRYIIEQLNAAPERCLLIDDRPENIAAAQTFGMQTMLCENPQHIAKQLEQLR